MNRFLCCLFLLGLNAKSFSQKQYFVYIQAETPQPFFIKINEKVYSADASGYLILPKLKDTTYTFKIGYPQNKWPEQQFSVAIRSKDHGFLLKQFDGKGWGLFDLQSLSVIMADDPGKDKTLKSNDDISAFTAILSRAANDPSLLEKPVALAKYDEQSLAVQSAVVSETVMASKEQPADNTVLVEQPAKKKDSSLSVKKEKVKSEDTVKIAEQQKKAEQPLAKNTGEVKKMTDTAANVEQSIKKEEAFIADKNPEKSKIGDQAVTLPKEQPVNSTVLIEQPAKKKDSSLVVKKEQVKNTGEVKKKTDTAGIVEQSTKKEESFVAGKNPEKNKISGIIVDSAGIYKRSVVTKRSESSTTEGLGLIFIDELAAGNRDTVQIIIPNQKEFVSNVSGQPAEQKKFLNVTSDEEDVSLIGAAVVNKKTCLSVATDNDFLKLRKKMAAQRTDDAMINESKKVFKTRCFTTEQVKNLGNLFLNESGKFQFYETAYPFNSDRNNFASLQTELKDAYFIHRFKKMIN